jgi:uncharacterized protein YehS (DUF1456 family)
MGVVIHIRLHEDLGCPELNKMRYNMEMAIWLKKWRKAMSKKDHDMMDRLNSDYERVGLP